MKKIIALALLALPLFGMSQEIPPGTIPTEIAASQGATLSSVGLEAKPEYPGGIAAFYKFISENFKTPAVDHDMQARIYVSFVVERDGTMSSIKILRDPGYGMGDEAKRVLKLITEKWKPGVQNGATVRASYNLPININITSDTKQKP